MERLERIRLEKAENLTNDICYYGLWQSYEQMEEGIAACGGKDKDMIKAFKAQLKFRKSVLKQLYQDKNVFAVTKKMPNGKYKDQSVKELKDNLTK